MKKTGQLLRKYFYIAIVLQYLEQLQHEIIFYRRINYQCVKLFFYIDQCIAAEKTNVVCRVRIKRR